MRVLYMLFIVFFALFFSSETVLAEDYIATEDQIWIYGLKDDWTNERNVSVGVNLDENIRYICICMERNGVYYVLRTISLNQEDNSFYGDVVLGDGSAQYEGITNWLVFAVVSSGDIYRHYFQVKMDFTKPKIYTDIFGDFGYEVLFDNRPFVKVWADDEVSEISLLRINPSIYQNTYVNSKVTPYIKEGKFATEYQYPEDNEYGYVITALDCAGNMSTRIIITRHNVTSRMKRIISRGNYD